MATRESTGNASDAHLLQTAKRSLPSGSPYFEEGIPREKHSGADRPHFPVWQWVLTLVGLYLAALLYGLDMTIAADVQTAVYEHFDDIENLAWVGLGFPLASGSCILLIGRLYGLFNTKHLFNVSMLAFEVGSAICGAAPNMSALIVGRVIAGMGGCGMYLGALTFFSTLGSPSKLVLYQALIGVFWGTGAILGPVVGGAFSVSKASWRWAFYINLPLAALMAPVYLFVAPSYNPRPDLTASQKLASIDWLGAFLMAGLFVIPIATIAFDGSTFKWSSGTSIALWIVSGLLLLGFIIQQRWALLTTPKARLFPVRFLKSRTMIMLFIATACSIVANAVTIYYIPLFFVFTRGDTTLHAAVRLLPYIVVVIFFILFAGGTLPLTGRYSIYFLVASVCMLAGSALMFTVRHDSSVSKIYGAEVLLAAGAGLSFQNAYAIAAAKVEEKDKADANAFMNTSQIGNTALSLAIAGSLYQNLGTRFLSDALRQYALPETLIQAALGGAGSDVLGLLPPEAVAIVVDTVAYTIARVFGMVVAAGALLLCASLAMKHEKIQLAG